MTRDERSPWHRDDLPAWAWVALVLARLGQLAALLLPFALAALLWWTWTHRRDPEVRRRAMFWLGQSGDPRALAFFEELLAGP